MLLSEAVRTYLSGVSLDETQKFAGALGICGAVLGLCGINGITCRQLRRYQTKSARKAAYVGFDIPKKSGGIRHISAPVRELKQIQQMLNLMLQTLCDVSPHATGFVPSRSVRTNAEIHVGQKLVFNCDLKDFFPSITKKMVRQTLITELRPYKVSKDVINLICSLVTVPREDGVEALPQGAPTSPVVSNLVLKNLDRRLSCFAEKHGCRYSRYADDITFSHSHGHNTMLPERIEAIYKIIEDEGLAINHKKTRIQTQNERKEVTGLTVGDKVNVSRAYVKQLRILLHLWESRGLEQAQSICTRDFCNGVRTDLVRVINGKINYLLMIKGREDSTYRRFKSRFRALTKAMKENREAE